ncbi:MAG TPA: hypothetical protein ENK84_09370 [Desulfobulbus sp.]|nr:hypothetical protein [Desulfobulbus sp.]
MKNNAQTITKAFITVAGDFIQLADNVDEARSSAGFAVIAWNISLYPKDQITEKIDLVAQEYEKSNPDVIKAELLAHDLTILVDKKRRLFPDIKRIITKIGVEENKEEYEIITESEPFEIH